MRFKNLSRGTAFVALLACSGCGGGGEGYSAPAGLNLSDSATVVGQKLHLNDLGDSFVCVVSIDGKNLAGANRDCRDDAAHPYSLTAGSHKIGVFVWQNFGKNLWGGSSARPEGIGGFDIALNAVGGGAYRLQAKESGYSRVTVWATDRSGKDDHHYYVQYFQTIKQSAYSTFENVTGQMRAPEKHRLLVIEDFQGRLGENLPRFEEAFRSFAGSCKADTDFFRAQESQNFLSLDQPKDPALSEAALQDRIKAFAPDGVLRVQLTSIQGFNGASTVPGAMTTGIYKLNITLSDKDGHSPQWSAIMSSVVYTPDHVSDIATALEGRFSDLGILANCPPGPFDVKP